MPTNKPVLKEVDQFLADYVPTYAPMMPSFLAGKAVKHDEKVGKVNFKRIEAMGDIRGKHITPKDTEIQQVNVAENTRTFKKYFLGNQFQLSKYQDQNEVDDVNRQVLDENWKLADEIFLLGEGTSNSTMVNNSLFHSADTNYVLENSTAIASGDTRLSDFHSKVITSATKADLAGGRKVIWFYGTDILPLYNSLYATSQIAWKNALQGVLGPNYSLAAIPAAITPNSSGWIVVNMDQIKVHYTAVPTIEDQGVNTEKKYAWWNYLLGSSMVEVLAANGIIRQPATLA